MRRHRCMLKETWDELKEAQKGRWKKMSSYDGVEHLPYIPPLALHCFSMAQHHLTLPSFHLEPVFMERAHRKLRQGGLRFYPCEYSPEPAFIRKRNERERHRVRCVNEGYARLRERLPVEFDDKRLSKVETLRAAIQYIKHLQGLLGLNIRGSLEADNK